MDLQPYFNTVEACIEGLGVNPADCRGDNPGQWNLKKGATTVWVDLWHIEREGRAYFQVMSPIFQMPTDESVKNSLLEDLLDINDRLYGVAFTTYKNSKDENARKWIYIKVIREADGMGQEEAQAMLLRVGNYADQYRQELAEKYSIQLG